MATTEINARGFTFRVDTTGSGNWVGIENAETWSHSQSAAKTDRTTFDDGGRPRHKMNSRTEQIKIKVKLQLDSTSGAEATGQAAFEAWGSLVDDDSVKPFQLEWPGGKLWESDATCIVNIGGGGNDDVVSIEYTIDLSGAKTVTPA